jgi:2-C-methyl-D-erythritol 4-phosphate cytidylyltransferase/2-C-methyl-D-erythritol 2,4-cyclodiphosphate synthase
VIPTVPIVDTLVSFDPVTKVTGPGGDRALMGAVQTPQGFGAAELISAYESASGDFTDDAAVMREAGHDVVSVEGDARGFKITYPEDLERARLLVSGGTQTRVGTVLDVHRYDPDGVLSLAGLLWPGEAGLSGHSDGDVVLHAIVDALLQAAGRGDLGSHFGSDRPEYADAQSAVFLNRALELVRDAGYRVHSVGVQIIANAPKIGPRREEAERHLTGLVGAPVALSATTTDGLGFTGRGEGMAALATAVLVTA